MQILLGGKSVLRLSDKHITDVTAKEIARLAGQGSSSEDQSGTGGSYGNNRPDMQDASGSTNTRKRKLLTADEKTKQNRDRNRDHAKNTRLRKKAYVFKLKELVDQLTEQKVSEEVDRRAGGEGLHESHSRRKHAVRLMLRYRAANVTDYDKWYDNIIRCLFPCIPMYVSTR